MANTPTKKTSLPDKSLVEKIVDDYQSSWKYRDSSWHTTWENMQKLYDSERVYVGYQGISDTFVSLPYSIIETMVSATTGDKPLVEYIPTKPEQNTNTEVLNGLFSYYWDLDSWTPKLVQHSRGVFKLGTSILRAYWNIDHPCLDIIPLRDFFCDPTTTFFSQEKARFMGHRFLADKDALAKEQVIDPDTGDFKPKYMNLDKLVDDYESPDQTAKQKKDMDMGSTLVGEAKGKQVEVICYETLDEVIYIANRQVVIYRNTNYFKERQQTLNHPNPTGMYSYIIDAYSPDEAQLYGKSVIEPVAKPVELLNDLTNQNVDAVSWSLDPEMELDPQYASYIDKMKSATGNVYPFKPGSYTAVQKPMLPSNVFNERSNIKNEIREITGINELLFGAMGGHGRTTAAEIKAQSAAAGRRFDLVVSTLESGGYYRLAKLVFQMVQLYVTTPTMFRVIGQKGVDWQKFDPKEFKDDYEPRVKLKVTIDNEHHLKIRDIKEMYSAMVGNPYIDEAQLTRFVLQKGFNLEPDDVDPLVKKPDQVASDASGQGKGKPPNELINYKDAPPDVQAQMEAAAGFHPSVTHGGAMESTASQQMADQAAHGEQIAPVPTTGPVPMTSNPASSAPAGTASGIAH